MTYTLIMQAFQKQVQKPSTNQSLFLEPLHLFLDKNSDNERAPFPQFLCITGFLPVPRAMHLDNVATYFHSVTCTVWYISLKNTAEGGQKLSFNAF